MKQKIFNFLQYCRTRPRNKTGCADLIFREYGTEPSLLRPACLYAPLGETHCHGYSLIHQIEQCITLPLSGDQVSLGEDSRRASLRSHKYGEHDRELFTDVGTKGR